VREECTLVPLPFLVLSSSTKVHETAMLNLIVVQPIK